MCPGCSRPSPASPLVTVTFLCLAPESQELSLSRQVRRAAEMSAQKSGEKHWEEPQGGVVCPRCVPSLCCAPASPSREHNQHPRHTLGTSRETLGIPISCSDANPKSLLAGIAAAPNSEGFWSTASTVRKSSRRVLVPQGCLGHSSWSNGKQKPRQQKRKCRSGPGDGEREGFYPSSTWQLQIPFIIYSYCHCTDQGLARDTIDRSCSESTKKGTRNHKKGNLGCGAGLRIEGTPGSCKARMQDVGMQGGTSRWAGQGIPLGIRDSRGSATGVAPRQDVPLPWSVPQPLQPSEGTSKGEKRFRRDLP